ncbi:ABC transporter ATP-binding protein [Acidipropionibacterium virtanenii]|uniref:ABC-type transporter ATP-binding protein EcsA n=1 Tax=Acidipropionibacterium virtanenii TaxID=2057246 RepID=A0A344UUX0_9ACTN|nr:ATP-binding cassette domain-containing protein [Acidipropionibacterium virtanenii]AXE39068.1 ABC-type transporter ATP-binding protein EcsA [Acidipropionibacterium virtanenii]
MNHNSDQPDTSRGIGVIELTRRYGDLVAADAVSFTVAPGAMTGFVGANGAGKTTTMRMIVGVLAVTSGSVTYNGHPITAADRRRIGYMPEERGLYPKQPVLDQLVYLARIHGVSTQVARRQAMGYLERFGLAERAKDVVEKLSLGNQQRVQVTASLLGSPAALILDEPFSGLDPVAVDAMAEVLREQSAAGVPVLFSSHQLDLVERLCDNLVILDHGRVVANGSTDQLRSGGPVRYRLSSGADLGWLRGTAGVEVVDLDGTSAVLEFNRDGVDQEVLARAMSQGPVTEFARILPSLSEIYREAASS